MGYIGQDEDHLESPGTPSCDSLQTSNPMQSSGVILQGPAPSMQNTEEAEAIGANKSRVRGQGAQRLAGSLEQGGVHHALMASGQRAQLGRQREGDQKVGARQQAVGLLLEPGL